MSGCKLCGDADRNSSRSGIFASFKMNLLLRNVHLGFCTHVAPDVMVPIEIDSYPYAVSTRSVCLSLENCE